MPVIGFLNPQSSDALGDRLAWYFAKALGSPAMSRANTSRSITVEHLPAVRRVARALEPEVDSAIKPAWELRTAMRAAN